ncbi:unnamed protein product [Sphagnum balticum]
MHQSEQIVHAIHEGQLDNVETRNLQYFNLRIPNRVPGIPDDLMYPERGWASKIEYQEALASLALEFISNYDKKFKERWGSTLVPSTPPLPRFDLRYRYMGNNLCQSTPNQV